MTSSPLPAKSSISLSTSSLARPRWPYLVGAFAGPMLGAGALLMLLAVGGTALHGAGRVGLLALAISGSLLGIAWLGVLLHGRGRGDVGPSLGSFAVTLSIAYLYVHRGNWSEMRVHDMIFAAALAGCSWAHVFARCLRPIRALATIAAVLWSVTCPVMHPSLELPPAVLQALWIFALGAFALTGCSLAVMFPRLRDA